MDTASSFLESFCEHRSGRWSGRSAKVEPEDWMTSDMGDGTHDNPELRLSSFIKFKCPLSDQAAKSMIL